MSERKFYIGRVDDEEVKQEVKNNEKQEKNTYQRDRFVSSIFGTKVKDEITVIGAQYGNKGLQYDAFRDPEKKIRQDDYKDYLTVKDSEHNSSINSISRFEERKERIDSYDERVNVTLKNEIRNDNYNNQRDEKVNNEIKLSNIEVHKVEKSEMVNDFSKEEFVSLNNEYEDIVFEMEDEEKEIIPLDDYVPEEKMNNVKKEKVVAETTTNEEKEVVVKKTTKKKKYVAPPLSLLKRGASVHQNNSDDSATNLQRDRINETLEEFGILGNVTHYTRGPAVTQFEIQLDPGIKVQKVKNIQSNIQAALQAKSIRIEAPIPGKSTIGIEVPNPEKDCVYFGELLSNKQFLNDGNPMNVVLGLDLEGKPIYLDLSKMPHALVAGMTGSGKSVCINCILTSILYKAHPDDVKMILVDPKIIEFSSYEDIPHLATPVITSPKIAATALKWAVEEMQNRYQLFKTVKVREFKDYNKVADTNMSIKHLPYLLIVVDELADLMLLAGNDVEDYIQRLTQAGRAAGIHLVIATQRPSVDVIKGTIKTNISTRIAFAVKTQVDSSIILDHGGAEKLLGKGDMLYNDSVSEQRLQGAFITNDEIVAVTDFVKENCGVDYIIEAQELADKGINMGSDQNLGVNDEYFSAIARFVVENQSASINRIQKEFSVGFNRAQAIMKALEELGIVSENLGSRARIVQVNMDELESILDNI